MARTRREQVVIGLVKVGHEALVAGSDACRVRNVLERVRRWQRTVILRQVEVHDADRRDMKARQILLRLAASTTADLSAAVRPATVSLGGDVCVSEDPMVERWRAAAQQQAVPAPDAEPLQIAGFAVWPVWRSHYVAASLTASPETVAAALDDQGFELVRFGNDGSGWPEAFARLTGALGR
jgi:hypothetical protein